MKIKKNDILKVIEVLQNAYDKLTEDEWYSFNEKDNSLIKENFILPEIPYCVKVYDLDEFTSVLNYFNKDKHSNLKAITHLSYEPQVYPYYISHMDIHEYSYNKSPVSRYGKILEYENFKSYIK